MTLLVLFFTLDAVAGLSRAARPLVRAREDLAALERICAAEEAKPAGVCASPSAAECRSVLGAYEGARVAAEAKVKEAASWWAKRGAVRDDGKTITITFELSSLPDYPYRDSNHIVNDALASSIGSLERMADAEASLRKRRDCRAAAKALHETWEENRASDSLSDFHNALGNALSEFLLDAQRALENGAAAEAAAGLEMTAPGVSVHPAANP